MERRWGGGIPPTVKYGGDATAIVDYAMTMSKYTLCIHSCLPATEDHQIIILAVLLGLTTGLQL